MSLTSVDVVAAEVVAIEKHELDPVALVEGHQADQQQQDGAQATRQLHSVHQLSWEGWRDQRSEVSNTLGERLQEVVPFQYKIPHKLSTEGPKITLDSHYGVREQIRSKHQY